MASKRIPVIAVALGCAVAPASAQAMTVRVGEPRLVAKVSVSVPVTVGCESSDLAAVVTTQSISVSISQAVNKEIAHGSGSALGGPFGLAGHPELLFDCDGAEHTATVNVNAATDGPPFKRSAEAVINASAFVNFGIPCSPGSTTCFNFVAQQSAVSGPVAIRLR